MAPKSVNWTDPDDVRAIEGAIELALERDGLEYEYEAVLEMARVYRALRTNRYLESALEAVADDWDDRVDDDVDALEMLARVYTGAY